MATIDPTQDPLFPAFVALVQARADLAGAHDQSVSADAAAAVANAAAAAAAHGEQDARGVSAAALRNFTAQASGPVPVAPDAPPADAAAAPAS